MSKHSLISREARKRLFSSNQGALKGTQLVTLKKEPLLPFISTQSLLDLSIFLSHNLPLPVDVS